MRVGRRKACSARMCLVEGPQKCIYYGKPYVVTHPLPQLSKILSCCYSGMSRPAHLQRVYQTSRRGNIRPKCRSYDIAGTRACKVALRCTARRWHAGCASLLQICAAVFVVSQAILRLQHCTHLTGATGIPPPFSQYSMSRHGPWDFLALHSCIRLLYMCIPLGGRSSVPSCLTAMCA